MTESTYPERPFPLEEAFVEECYLKMLVWGGCKEKTLSRRASFRSEEMIDTQVIDYQFGTDEHKNGAFRKILDGYFMTFSGTECSEEDFRHIVGNGLGLLKLLHTVPELYSDDRAELIKFLLEERNDIKSVSKKSYSEDETHLNASAYVRLAAFDKMLELMIGKRVASEIIRDSGLGVSRGGRE